MEQAKLRDVLKEEEIRKIEHLYNISLNSDFKFLTVKNLFDMSLYIVGNETNGHIPNETNLVSMTWGILTERAINKNLTIF